ncbi:uncharacterized protein [Watersipora subatra]|uniref:uncharacterized protein n=1 Tax=Watersipora subatra TaxID=2589382 RepID=UPI00355C4F34
MAAAHDPSATIIECGYCLKKNENLEKPKLLPCGHIHCSGCLDGVLDARKIVECPDCKQVLTGLIYDLPDAMLGNSVLQHFCDVCKDKSACHEAVMLDHHTVTIKEFISQPKRFAKQTCTEHNDKPLIFSCRKCRSIFCEECAGPSSCGGVAHQLATLKVIADEVKNEVKSLRDKAESRKDGLCRISKDADRALSEYEDETQRLLTLLDSTRDMQLNELKTMYASLKLEAIRQRKLTAEEIKKFKEEVVEEELSLINVLLQKVFKSLSDDNMIDLVRNCKETKAEILSAVEGKLPSLKVPAGVTLVIKDGTTINAAICSSAGNIDISLTPSLLAQLQTPSTDQNKDLELECKKDEIKSRSRRQVEVKDEFDKLHYEFLKIIHAKEFTSKILEKFKGKLTESEHPDNDQLIVVTVKSYIPGEAERMMDALIELFNDVTKSVYSHSIKHDYSGSKTELGKALTTDLQDPNVKFIARLVTDEKIRIIGSPANKERDLRTLEIYLLARNMGSTGQTKTAQIQTDITLPNGTLVSVIEGDLTNMKADALVSPSRADLIPQSGISKAIAIACGQRFQVKGTEFIKARGLLKEGDLFTLMADGRLVYNGVRYVIHAIAPVPKKGTSNYAPTSVSKKDADVESILLNIIKGALKEAEDLKCRTIALPTICAGSAGVPLATCARSYWTALVEFSSKNSAPHLKHVYFVNDRSTLRRELYSLMVDMSAK